MKKSFIKVALFGVLAITAANFVGCTDYDDDIKNLQGQVDELKSVSIADIDSQLKALKEADANLATTCSTLEAAIDEIKANLESLTKASEALKVAVDGKVDKSVYDAAIEALNGQCAELAAKLSVLSDLQAAIDALNANKADKTALDAINKAIEELKAKDAKLAEDLAALQTTINAALDGKADKTALDKLEKDLQTKLNEGLTSLRSDLEGRIGGIETSLKDLATKAELEAAKKALEDRIAKLETSNESLKTATENNKKAIEDLSKIVTPLKTLVDGINSRLGVAEGNISALQESIGQVDTKISMAITNLQLILEGKIDAIDAAYKAADTELARRIKVLEEAKFAKESDLNAAKADITTLKKEIYGENGEGGLKNNLSALKVQVDNLFIEGTAENGQLKQAIGAEITAALQKGGAIQKAIDAAISAATGRIDVLDSQVRDLMARIQSIVFVPQYTNDNGAFVPAYFINKVGGEMTIKFRISPADRAIELAEMAQKRLGGDAPILSFIVEGSALETRAAAEDLNITGVTGTGDGIIAVTATPKYGKFVDDKYFPTAMIVSTTKTTEEKGDSITNITTEYFKVKGQNITADKASLVAQNFDIDYADTEVRLVNTDFSAQINYGAGNIAMTKAQIGFDQNLEIYSVNTGSANIVINDKGEAVKAAEKNDLKTYLESVHFELNGNTGVKLTAHDPLDANPAKKIDLTLKDMTFGYASGTTPAKTYDASYTIVKVTANRFFDYKEIAKAAVWSGENDNKAKDYKGSFTISKMTTLYADKNADPANVLTEMKASDSNNKTTYSCKVKTADGKTNTISISSNDYKMAIDLTTDVNNVTIHMPENYAWGYYEFETVYETSYGNITAKAQLNLSYPGHDTFLTAITARWTKNNEIYFVQYDKPADTVEDFAIVNELNSGIAQAYNKAPGAIYTYELVDKKYYSNIAVTSEGKITIDGEIKYDNTDAKPAAIHLSGVEAINNVQIKVTVSVAGNYVMEEPFHITLAYPMPATIDVSTVTKEYTGSAIKNNVPLDIAKGVNMKDKHGWDTEMIKNGIVSSYANKTWGMTGATYTDTSVDPNVETEYVKYEFVSATGGLTASDFTISKDGKLKFEQANLANDQKVTIKVSIVYNYGVAEGTFTVDLKNTFD